MSSIRLPGDDDHKHWILLANSHENNGASSMRFRRYTSGESMIEPDKCRPPSFGTFHGERPSRGILFAYLNPVERPCPYNSQNCYQSAGPLAATLLRCTPALNSSRTPFRIVARERTMSNPKHSKCILRFFNPQPLRAEVKSGLNISRSLERMRYTASQLITSFQNFMSVFFTSYTSNFYKLYFNLPQYILIKNISILFCSLNLIFNNLSLEKLPI